MADLRLASTEPEKLYRNVSILGAYITRAFKDKGQVAHKVRLKVYAKRYGDILRE